MILNRETVWTTKVITVRMSEMESCSITRLPCHHFDIEGLLIVVFFYSIKIPYDTTSQNLEYDFLPVIDRQNKNTTNRLTTVLGMTLIYYFEIFRRVPVECTINVNHGRDKNIVFVG